MSDRPTTKSGPNAAGLGAHAKRELSRVFASAPFVSDLGIRLADVAAGYCQSVLDLDQKHLQHDGYVHAGVEATMADHTAGAAAATLLRQGQIVLTAEFKISLLRAARGDRLRCEARVLKAGSRLSFVESEVFCESGDQSQPVAKATVTLAVVQAPPGPA